MAEFGKRGGGHMAVISKKKNRNGAIIEVFMLIISITVFVLPFVNQIAVSFSSGRAIISGDVYLWPIEPTTEAWRNVFSNRDMIFSFFYTIALTAVVTVGQLVCITLAAYPLAAKNLRGRGFLFAFFMIPMYFSGGLIPTYLLYSQIKLLNNVLVMILPGLFSMYNMLILRTSFRAIPDSLEESAKLDGATDFTVLLRIFVPLCVPTFATLALFAAVSRWNAFTDAIFFMPNNQKYVPLQLVLQRTLQSIKDQERLMEGGGATRVRVVEESQKAANLLFTVVPIILIYPLLQRFFIKGVMIGAIKS